MNSHMSGRVCLIFSVWFLFTIGDYGVQAAPLLLNNTIATMQAFQEMAPMYYDRLHTFDEVAVAWTIEDGTTLHLAAAVMEDDNLLGWFGLGFSDAGSMAGSDIVVLETALWNENDEQKELRLSDMFALGFARPVSDECQSWTLHASTSSSENYFLAFEASRLLDTEDSQDIALTVDDSSFTTPPTSIIAAWGGTDQLSFHGPNHTARSTVRLHYNAATLATSDGEVLSSREMLRQKADGSFFLSPANHTLSTEETVYHSFCIDLNASTLVGFPSGATNATKIYMIGADQVPSLERNGVDTTRYVHHLSADAHSMPCDLADGEDSRANFFYGWAPGHEALVLPEGVGIALGSGGFASLSVTIHYDNAGGESGIVDDTSIEVFYVLESTEEQSQSSYTEAQAWVVGDPVIGLFGSPTMLDGLPTSHTFNCPSSCTSEHLNASVTVFAEAVHAHETAQRIVSRVLRADGTVKHESNIDVWDFNANGMKKFQLDSTFTVDPGDKFETVCIYDFESVASDYPTFGLGTREEMCQALFWYYPAIYQGYGFCGPSLSSRRPEEHCDATHLQSTVNATYGRLFGTPPIGECKVVSGAATVDSAIIGALFTALLFSGIFLL